MSSSHFHISVQQIKEHVIRIAESISQNDNEQSRPFVLVFLNTDNTIRATVHGTVSIIRNALSPNVYGGTVSVQGHYFKVPAGEAMVDYDLELLQFVNDAPIALANIRGFDLIQSNDVDTFAEQVKSQIIEEWQ